MTPHFDCPICLDPTVKRLGLRRFRLEEHEIRFIDSNGRVWLAPIGTETDGGSIPWIAQPAVGDPIDSDALPAFVEHDHAYQQAPPDQAGFIAADISPQRREADRMLHEACIAAGLSRRRARWIWEGVRLGGWYAWRQHAIENRKGQAGA